MFRTQYTISVLSEEPISPHLDIAGVVEECNTGSFVMADIASETTELSGQEMARALLLAGSEPEFFNLNEEGEVIDPCL